ncbi:cilia- and flagella-associated protein 299-like [Drosophila innubila]|uniref:cilia- and flagella-associated protein 299-like n=1 Tax=Drosophila innubila TaxID=198719 RepID=UPI00148B75F1|nr:cilia- and flagella-associated protein 299-like [Drosophila innubila]
MAALRPDFTLLNFNTYSEYLKSFQSIKDQRYIDDEKTINALVKLGYSNAGRIYEEDEFKKCKEMTLEVINPKIKLCLTSGHLVKGDDPALLALAEREKPNLLKKLSTIIFIVVRLPSGFDVSSYKDYEHSLRQFDMSTRGSTNWKGVFQGTHKLRPRPSDLSFYDTQKKYVTYNDSDNYHTLSIGHSLLFLHKGDHKMIVPEQKPSLQTTAKRTMFLSPVLGTIILYDHIVRKPV